MENYLILAPATPHWPTGRWTSTVRSVCCCLQRRRAHRSSDDTRVLVGSDESPTAGSGHRANPALQDVADEVTAKLRAAIRLGPRPP